MWVLYSLFFAVFTAFGTFLTKNLTKKINPLPLLYIFGLFNIPFTFVLLLFLGGIPHVTPNFYLYIGIAGLLDSIAFACAIFAINRSSISLIAPISSFTPVFTTLIAIFALHEIPTPIKFSGILMIVVGTYFLNIVDIKRGILAPFKTLFNNRGVLLYLLASFIWGITPIFQKKAIFETTPQIPLFVSVVGMIFVLLFLTPFAFKKAIKSFKEIKSNLKWFLINGIGTAFSQAALYAAYVLTFVGYSISINRLSTLFIIILGGVFLKEERIKERLLGASVMLVGALLLAL